MAYAATRTVSGTSDTPTTSDDGGLVQYTSASGKTITLSGTSWVAGRSAFAARISGGGTATFVGAGGVTVNGDLTIASGQTVVAQYTASNTWEIVGTDVLPVASGGTGASTAAGARANLVAARRAVFDIRDYGAVGNGTTDDAGAIQDAIDAAAAAGGGTVLIPSGVYAVESGLSVPQRVGVKGVGRGSYLLATAAIETLFTFEGPGAGGFLEDFEAQAYNDELENLVKVDTWHHFEANRVAAYGLTGYFALVTEDQASGSNTEHIRFTMCDLNSFDATNGAMGFAKVTAGATGYCTDVYFDRCFVVEFSDWAFDIEDAQRCKVIDCYAGANSQTPAGGVRLAVTGVPAGAPGGCGQHKVDGFHIEDFNGSGNAIAVLIEATSAAGATDYLRYNDVARLSMSPAGDRTIVEVRNSATTPYIVLQNTIRDFAMVPYSADSIKIGSTTFGTNIEQLRENDKISNYVTLSGLTWSRVNGWQQAQGYGAGATPAMTFLDVGDFVRNTDDGAIWVVDETGTPRRIGLATLSNAYSATNVTTDRSYDANATTLDELADVVGTLLADLKTAGVLP